MSREGQIWSGVAILGLGLFVTVASYSGAQGGGRYIVATGAIVVGLVRIVRGLSMSDEPGSYRGSGKDVDPAPLGDDRAPLIGGAPCSHCKKKIESRLDGTACKVCNQPVHHDCSASHREQAHAKGAA